MTSALTRVQERVASGSWRFDPRAVVVGVLILVIGVVVGFGLLGRSTEKADQVAAPVASLCREGGVTAARLEDTGACQAASAVAVPPYKSETVPGPMGPAGAAGDAGDTGAAGAAGQPGPQGPQGVQGPAGPSGAPGEPGSAGSDGADGVDGNDGTDGEPGKPGPVGATGAVGAVGPAGRDGSPAASQTFVTDDGREFQCTRTGGEDTAPVYSCSQTAGPTVMAP